MCVCDAAWKAGSSIVGKCVGSERKEFPFVLALLTLECIGKYCLTDKHAAVFGVEQLWVNENLWRATNDWLVGMVALLHVKDGTSLRQGGYVKFSKILYCKKILYYKNKSKWFKFWTVV